MNSILSWVGGKRLLRQKISTLVPEDIASYIEPFGGAGWVLFFKDRWAHNEVYNDIDGELVNLFRSAKFHVEELQKEFKFLVASRELFAQIRENRGLTELQRAARFLYLIKYSFGALGEHFGIAKIGKGAISHKNITEMMEKVHLRMDKVTIEHLSYEEIFKRYDHPKNFFYCDPPYMHGVQYKSQEGKPFDHERLCKELKKLKGRWLLSLDDCREANEMFKDFTIEHVVRQKGIERKYGDMIYREVLIRNY